MHPSPGGPGRHGRDHDQHPRTANIHHDEPTTRPVRSLGRSAHRNPGRDRPGLPRATTPAPPRYPRERGSSTRGTIGRDTPRRPHGLRGAARSRSASRLRPPDSARIAGAAHNPPAPRTGRHAQPAADRGRPGQMASELTSCEANLVLVLDRLSNLFPAVPGSSPAQRPAHAGAGLAEGNRIGQWWNALGPVMPAGAC